MASLLVRLKHKGVAPEYIDQILTAFGTKDERRRAVPPLSPTVLRPSSSLIEPLTAHELDVLELLAQRLSNKEIAQQLVVSPETVKKHTLRIYHKLGVKSRREATSKAIALGILSDG